MAYFTLSRYLCTIFLSAVLVILALVWLPGQQSAYERLHASISYVQDAITPGHSTTGNHHDEYVAICMAVKDQGRDLPEFLQHHYYSIGIRRFYIMDDGSNPPLSSMVDTYGVPEDALTFVYFDASQKVPSMQYKIYSECASTYGVNNTWLAFLDADEFLDTPGHETLDEILRGLEPLKHVGALGVNWQTHSSNGQLTRAKSVRETYTECIYDDDENNGEGSDNKHIKSIVRQPLYGSPINPHKFNTNNGSITVGEFGDEVSSVAFRQPITRERVSLHHYGVKSKEEYQEKIDRDNAMSQPKDWGWWNHIMKLPKVECREMLRWIQ